MATEDKILARVRQMIAIAEHPNTPAAEAETALREANRLMAKHAIEEAMLQAGQTLSDRRAPVQREFALSDSTNEFMPMLRTILSEIVAANRCRAMILGGAKVQVFGMDEDVRWVEMLYTSIYFQFINQINPRWDSSKGYDENVYNFKVAGYKWLDINAEAMKHGERDTRHWKKGRIGTDGQVWSWIGEHRNFDPETNMGEVAQETMSGVLKAAYKRHANKIEDFNQVRTSGHARYRRDFAEGFKIQLSRRIRKMASDASEEADSTPGAALALVDMKGRIDDLFFEFFPAFSPEEMEKRRLAALAQQEQERLAREKMLNEMTEKQRYAFLEKEAAKERRDAKANRRYWDRLSIDGAAQRRGQTVANSVDLSRKAGAANAGSERKSIG